MQHRQRLDGLAGGAVGKWVGVPSPVLVGTQKIALELESNQTQILAWMIGETARISSFVQMSVLIFSQFRFITQLFDPETLSLLELYILYQSLAIIFRIASIIYVSSFDLSTQKI